jgi:hypothetical protein
VFQSGRDLDAQQSRELSVRFCVVAGIAQRSGRRPPLDLSRKTGREAQHDVVRGPPLPFVARVRRQQGRHLVARAQRRVRGQSSLIDASARPEACASI